MIGIDLNCDLGEGAGHDHELMPLLSSANIACGGHAGNAATMREAVMLARECGVAVGAHPGFPDRVNFGRRAAEASPADVLRLVTEQVRTLAAIAPIRHVKLHGALYHLAARDRPVAEAVVAAVQAIAPQAILFTPAAGELACIGGARGLRVAAEAFADRSYREDGTLTPRGELGAMISDPDAMVAQVLGIIRRGVARATNGAEVPVAADTFCLHGDSPHAVEFAHRIRRELAAAGIAVRPVFAPATSA